MTVEHERKELAATVGTRENAELLFKPKVAHSDLDHCAKLVLRHLDFLTGTNSMTVDFRGVPEAKVAEWASRLYANTLAHLCETDLQVRTTYLTHRSYIPDDDAVRQLFLAKAYSNFNFFMWLIASPSQPPDPRNLCYLRFVVLQDVVLLEDINATRDGNSGGWAWLDKSIAGLRDVAKGFDIRRIKAVATNERVYRAFLKRGFRDQAQLHGFDRHVENYAKSIELSA